MTYTYVTQHLTSGPNAKMASRYLIKLTPNVLIQMYRPYVFHVHRS